MMQLRQLFKQFILLRHVSLLVSSLGVACVVCLTSAQVNWLHKQVKLISTRMRNSSLLTAMIKLVLLFGISRLVFSQQFMTDGITECQFPFEFQGVSYDECVQLDATSGFYWCKDADGNFGMCQVEEANSDPPQAADYSSPVAEDEAEETGPGEAIPNTANAPLTVPSPVSALGADILGLTQQSARAPAQSSQGTSAIVSQQFNDEEVELPEQLTSTVDVNVVVEGQADSLIVINEVATNNPVGGNDWFELYNKGEEILDLTGWKIQDNDGNSFVIGEQEMCQIPFLTEILPKSFLKFSQDVQCSFDFGFGAEDKIALFNPEGELVDSITWTTADTFPELTIGRYPDGHQKMVFLNPTPGSPNEPASTFFIDATASSGAGLLGNRHACCQMLEKIGFSSNLPVMVIDTFGQQLFHKTDLSDEQWQVVIDTIDPSGGVLKSPSQLCTCSEYEDYDGWAGVQYRGQTSFREFDKKGLGFELRESDNQTNRNFPLLGLPKENDWVLNNPENDGTLGFRNVMAFTLARKMGRYASRYRFLELFLINDGAQELSMDHYAGIYMLLEKIKRDSNRVPVQKISPSDETGGYIFKYDNDNIDSYDKYITTLKSRLDIVFAYPDLPSPIEQDYAFNFFNEFEAALLSENWLDPESGYRSFIDYGSFIDYMLAVEITKNPDAYRGSTYMFKDANGALNMGPIWDVNEAFGMCCGYPIEGYENSGKSEGISGGSAISPEGFRFLICAEAHRCKIDPTDGVSQWYRRMWQDEQFRKDTNARWQELRADAISNQVVEQLFNETQVLLQDAAIRNYERWQDGRLMNGATFPDDFEKEWLNDIETLRTWLIAHMNWMDQGWAKFAN
eukprot:TRINITY_DN1364_c0_g1_i2.p1 TRINITY_DN1364_c0_g1~~TRINITY_DN1364_c0_g1_i2.p1  ORF type:complete len:851 (-),score=112.54 TRINITY_DN1364_c0_g1_i2:1379-3931(-)